MSTTIFDIDELELLRGYFDYLHAGIIDQLVSFESDSWGCPVEGTEEIREYLEELSELGFQFEEKLDKYIEWKKTHEFVPGNINENKLCKYDFVEQK